MRIFSTQFLMNMAKAIWSALEYPLTIIGKSKRNLDDCQIHGNSVQDGTPTPDVPVEVQSVGDLVTEGEHAGKYKIPVTIKGKNLIDFKKAKARNTDTSLTITDTGVIYTGNYYFIIPCDIKAGTKVAFSCVSKWLQRVVFYSGSTADVTIWTSGSTATTTKDIDKLYVYKNNSSTTDSNMVFDNIQLEYNSKTAYEPYIEPVTTDIYLDEPLRKLGEHADYIDFKNGKVVRKCVLKRLKNYNWTASTEYDTHYTFMAHDTSILPNASNYKEEYRYGYSDMFNFEYGHNPGSKADTIWMYNWAMNVRVTIAKSRLQDSTVASFNQWLNENNPYMIRIRTNALEENISDIPTLPQFKGTTAYETETTISPSGIQVKYY